MGPIVRAALVATLLATVALRVAEAAPSARRCEKAVARRLVACVERVAARERSCRLDDGTACAGDRGIAAARRTLERRVRGACPTPAVVQAAGYGAAATPDGLVARVLEACAGEPATLVARTFGGPQAAVLSVADAAGRACLDTAMQEATALLTRTARAHGDCLARARRGRPCLATVVSDAEAAATAAIAAACPDLKARIGLHPAAYVARTGAQARCLTAVAHGDTAPLALDCGPRPGAPVPARGVWTKITLDPASGARCGDGSPYAFWMRLAPAGEPLDRVVVDLHPGGACFTEAQCLTTPPDLLRVGEGDPPAGGWLADDPAANVFAGWTRVSLPYCTQDLHVGAGVTSVFPGITVARFGAVNVRGALAHVRDVLWQALGATDGAGYRPDRLRVLFGGRSAGGWGVRFNLHWVLDELRWTHTTTIADGGQALDNGMVLGVRSLNLLIQQEAGPIGWDARSAQPPYCLGPECVGDVLQTATAPRLGTTPEQLLLNVTNQYDPIQTGTNLFASPAAWIDAMRTSYCTMRGTPGVFYWLPASSVGFHTILTDPARWNTTTAGGVTVAEWLAGVVADPGAVVDRVDEGTLVTDFPGVRPIACLP